MTHTRYIVICLCFLLNSGNAWAGNIDKKFDNQRSFASFSLGMESLSYQESLPRFGLKAKTTVTNFIQRSGGYTPFNADWGFYLSTVSSIDSQNSTESWKIGTTSVQTDLLKIEAGEINLSMAYNLKPGHQLIGGLSIQTFRHTRSNFITSASISQQPLGAVTENFITALANIGYSYDTFFVDPDQRFRFMGGIIIGTPMYYKVDNSGGTNLDLNTGNLITQPPFEVGKFFAGGYDLKINAGAGIKLSNHFTAMALGEYTFRDQPAVSAGIGNSTGTVPNITIYNFRLMTSLIWSF